MERRFVIDRDLFSGRDVTQRDKENVVVRDLHERVWLARVVDVVSAIPAATAIKAPTIVDSADPQTSPLGPSFCLSGGDALAGVLGDLVPAAKVS